MGGVWGKKNALSRSQGLNHLPALGGPLRVRTEVGPCEIEYVGGHTYFFLCLPAWLPACVHACVSVHESACLCTSLCMPVCVWCAFACYQSWIIWSYIFDGTHHTWTIYLSLVLTNQIHPDWYLGQGLRERKGKKKNEKQRNGWYLGQGAPWGKKGK